MREYNETASMLKDAERLRDSWGKHSKTAGLSKGDFAEAIRNYNALRGVVKALRWMLKDKRVRDPLS